MQDQSRVLSVQERIALAKKKKEEEQARVAAQFSNPNVVKVLTKQYEQQ